MIPHIIPQLTDETLDKRIVEAGVPFGVAFLRNACIPSHHFRPELDRLVLLLCDRMEIYSLDVDVSPSITEEFLVEYVPTLMVFAKGDEIARYEGHHDGCKLYHDLLDILYPSK